MASPKDPEEIKGYIFSAFDNSRAAPRNDAGPATGAQNYSHNQSYLTSNKDMVGSNELKLKENQELIIWTDEQHFTIDDSGKIMNDPEKDATQFVNPMGIAPVVFLSKSRHNQTWSTVGSDQSEIALLIQLAWSDLLTIAKHQGYSLLTFTGKEPPEKLTMGINRAIFLKQDDSGVAPTVDYLTANSPLSEYKDILVELLAMFLTTNDMNPQAVGGTFAANNATSGFHALIQSADTLEAVEADKPALKYAEQNLWQVIAKYHNYLFDIGSDQLNEKARALGKFSEDFSVQIQYSDIKPLESEQEVIQNVTNLRGQGLMSRRLALKKLYSDMSDEQIEALMQEIDGERLKTAQSMMDSMTPSEPLEVEQVEQETPEEQDEVEQVAKSDLDTKVSSEALNGAQVTALTGLANSVALNQLPAETAKQIAMAAFGVTQEVANQIFNPASTFTPEVIEKPIPKI
jgi:hypothetical protein